MLKTEKLSTEEQLTNQLKNFTIEEAREDQDYMSKQITKQRQKIGEENIKDDGTSYNTNKIRPKERIWN